MGIRVSQIRQAAALAMLLASAVLHQAPLVECSSRRLLDYHGYGAHSGRQHHMMALHRRDFFHSAFSPSMVNYDNLKQCDTLAETVHSCGVGCCSSVIRFWEIGCFCNAIIMAFNEKVAMMEERLHTCGSQEGLDVAALEAHKCGQDSDLVDAGTGDCQISRFDLDRLRVSSILDMHNQWVTRRSLALAVERSLGSKLSEEASFVFISPRGVITKQQAANELDHDFIDERVQPAGIMAPTWFSARTFTNRVTFFAKSSDHEHVYFGIQYQPCSDRINAILIEGIRPTGSWEEDLAGGQEPKAANVAVDSVQAADEQVAVTLPNSTIVDPYGDIWEEDISEDDNGEEESEMEEIRDLEEDSWAPDSTNNIQKAIDNGLEDLMWQKAVITRGLRRVLKEEEEAVALFSSSRVKSRKGGPETDPQGPGDGQDHPRSLKLGQA